jgi:hypothetical protein
MRELAAICPLSAIADITPTCSISASGQLGSSMFVRDMKLNVRLIQGRESGCLHDRPPAIVVGSDLASKVGRHEAANIQRLIGQPGLDSRCASSGHFTNVLGPGLRQLPFLQSLSRQLRCQRACHVAIHD